jgi:hypothetical protein
MTKHQSEPNAQPAREARITEGVRDMLAILEDPTATEDEKSMAASTIVEAVAPDIMEAAQPASDCTYCNGTGLVQVHDQSNWQTEVCPCCKWKRQPPASEPSVFVACPFCAESDFDLPGLKLHLQAGWCEQFNSTTDLARGK